LPAQLAALYGELARLTGSSVVELNRAVAIAEAGELEAALALAQRLALDRCHNLHATRSCCAGAILPHSSLSKDRNAEAPDLCRGASEPSDRTPRYAGDEQVPKLKSLMTNLSGGRNVMWLVTCTSPIVPPPAETI
jgi:hypothetical protein